MYFYLFKVREAQLRGAIGIILFSDPSDVTGGDINQVYPHDWWLPPSGVQRGVIRTGQGDPLTADYPAISKQYEMSCIALSLDGFTVLQMIWKSVNISLKRLLG